ncbi:MAG TPA: hypothetical protein VGX23_06725 [Actinocrinis sp.]|nr:hypothetical protein [Actinocrinis sp.]
MARDRSGDEPSPGFDIELDGEVDDECASAATETLADDPWSADRPSRPAFLDAWQLKAEQALAAWWSRTRSLLTWRTAAWVAGAALLGIGLGAAGEPTAETLVAARLSTDYALHLGSQPITAPGQAQLAKLAGAAWSVSPVTPLIVHVVNDGSTTLHLHAGALSGQHISRGALIPDGSGVLAPGQAGTLTAQVALDCSSRPTDIGENTASTSVPLVASIPVNSDSGPTADVQLTAGTRQDALYIALQLCTGLPAPLTVSVQDLPGTAPLFNKSIRIVLHNITSQAMLYSTQFGPRNPGTVAKTQTIAAGATITVDEPLTQICFAPTQSPTAPSVEVSTSTLDGSYQTTLEQAIEAAPEASACH